MKFYSIISYKVVIPGVVCAALISACNLPGGFTFNAIDVTAIYQTANAFVSQKLETPRPTHMADTTPVLSVISPTPLTTQSAQSTITATHDIAERCDQAGAGNPLDVSIPDDTRLVPTEPFTKVWRLANLGSCDWTPEYAVVWFSGDDLGAVREQPFLSSIAPGETIEFAVDMIAPTEPGLYSGYWMLRNKAGDLFGIGPNGNSPFWVRIQVVAVETAVPTSTATLLPTSIVLASGDANLKPGQPLDLDSGQATTEGQADVRLEQNGSDPFAWTPMNNARFSVFGLNPPNELECQYATLSDQPIAFTSLENGIYLCYRTSEGLPGQLQIEAMPDGNSTLHLKFTTWAIP